MHILTSLSYGELREMTTPRFTVGSHSRALVPVLVLGLFLTGYFGWLYYKDWQMKRKFRRYWEGRERKMDK